MVANGAESGCVRWNSDGGVTVCFTYWISSFSTRFSSRTGRKTTALSLLSLLTLVLVLCRVDSNEARLPGLAFHNLGPQDHLERASYFFHTMDHVNKGFDA